MTKVLSLRSALCLAASLAVVTLVDATVSDAAAKSACVKGRHVFFVEDGKLTSGLSGGITNCWVYEGDDATAKKLSSGKNDCWVEAWGKCTGPSDEGWVRLRKIRAAK